MKTCILSISGSRHKEKSYETEMDFSDATVPVCCPSFADGRHGEGGVTPEFFLEMTADAQEQHPENTGMSYEEAAG